MTGGKYEFQSEFFKKLKKPPLRAVIGLGANLGDRRGTMESAARAVAEIARVERTSPVYETDPVGPPQPGYLNAALLALYDGSPEELLDALLAIEHELGRVRAERWGPRTIDLDILWIEGVLWETDRLSVPHPRLRERPFAIVPLLDVAPHATDPASGEPYVRPPEILRRFAAALARNKA